MLLQCKNYTTDLVATLFEGKNLKNLKKKKERKISSGMK